MNHPPLLFLDTETLGLDIEAPIWEVAAIRVEPHSEQTKTWLVEHDPTDENGVPWLNSLPDSFAEDYLNRFVRFSGRACNPFGVVEQLAELAKGAIVCGSNPSFDMQRLEKLSIDCEAFRAFGWHYHAMDIPTLAHGWLLGKGIAPAPPWKSDFLSQACGVSPRDFDRHSALGDARWCKALWERITQ